MKMMKLLPLLLVLLMLAACGNNNKADDWEPPSRPTSVTQPTEPEPTQTEPKPTEPVIEPTDPMPTEPTQPDVTEPTDPDDVWVPTDEDHVHRFGSWKVEKTGTCVKEGTKIRRCDCGEVERKTYLGDHTYGDWTVKDESTCTETGWNVRNCTACQAEELTIKPILPHDEVVTPGTPATCTTAGISDSVYCARCEAVLEEAVVIEAGHTVVIQEAIAPSCGVEGRSQGSYCSTCSEVFEVSEILPALKHVTVTIFPEDPTCTDLGFTEMEVCEHCGMVMAAPEILDRLGHDLVDGVCSRCGHTCDHGVDPQNPGKAGDHETLTGMGQIVEGVELYHQNVTCQQCGEVSKILPEETVTD